MNCFKHILFVFCFVFLATCVNAQTRLRTKNTYSNSEIFEKVFGNTNNDPGFIEDNSRGGFRVNQKNCKIVFTDRRNDEQKIVPISAKFCYALNEMFNMVVLTSSPQNGHQYLSVDDPYCHFVYREYSAVCVDDKGYPSWVELISICESICDKCRKGENPESDELYVRISKITAEYKNLIFFEFRRDNKDSFMNIGDDFSYLYVTLTISPDINTDYDNDTCKNILEQVASYLLHNSDGRVNCNITMNKEKKPSEGIEDINITPDEFSAERLIEICRQILCS